ncbi:hypothetical protein [Aquibacillus rhizosphaerae]|uniref:Uncharacterized protein n=1 Tax=Aquibacillus rhizosphaerae TaxID=3051431 RepID=A0ABT7LCE3_9BACI|nr:hypothetical protein [Aquibacillus sp. LR5S19]MDL4842226.1 hypothetical protein [Aquibacillus sp. LR5S19]
MSEFAQFDNERKTIDALLKDGYAIKNLKDNLDGAIVTFAKDGKALEILHISMADTRKYISNLIFMPERGT